MGSESQAPIVLDYAPAQRCRRKVPWGAVALSAVFVAGAVYYFAPIVMPPRCRTYADITRHVVSSNGTLAQAVKMYKRDVAQYPRVLADLQTEPLQLQGTGRWSGPYLEDPQGLTDPWGNPYQYRVPGVRNKKGFDLWSMGPDGVSGTTDDILGGG